MRQISQKIQSIMATSMTDDDENCSICFDSLGGIPRDTCQGCKKAFHSNCFNLWLARRNTCPLCRKFDPCGLLPAAANQNSGGDVGHDGSSDRNNSTPFTTNPILDLHIFIVDELLNYTMEPLSPLNRLI